MPRKRRKGAKRWRKSNQTHAEEEAFLQGKAGESSSLQTSKKRNKDAVEDRGPGTAKLRARNKRLRAEISLDNTSSVRPVVNRNENTKRPKYGVGQQELSLLQRMVNKVQSTVAVAGSTCESTDDNQHRHYKASMSYDIWSCEEAVQAKDDWTDPFLSKPPPKRKTRVQPLVLPSTSVLESHSYNPSTEEHQLALRRTYEIEQKKMKEEVRINKKLRYRRPKGSSSHMMIMLGTSDTEGEQTDTEEGVKKIVICERKTRAQRNKEKRLREQKRELRRQRTAHRKKQDLERLPEIVKSIETQEEQIELSTHANAKTLKPPKRLGPFRYEERSTVNDVLLSEELPSSIREVAAVPTKTLWDAQYHKFIQKGFIESRVPVTKSRRYALKTYEKRR